MAANVLPFPTIPLPDHGRAETGGDYTVRVKLRGAGRWPMKGGQGDYEPCDLLLVWSTSDGTEWTFRHAILNGPQIDQPGPFNTSQTLYLGDPGYKDCEPIWLPGMVAKYTPGR